MNVELQSQFDRVEAALTTLLDSISSYNPSPAAATSLLSADDDLSKALEKLATHQRNHTHLLSLRATTAALDAQLKASLTLLADTRKELLANAPAAPRPVLQNSLLTEPLRYNDLLDYAARIARFTVPPSSRRPFPADLDPQGQPAPAATPQPTPASPPPLSQPTPSNDLDVSDLDKANGNRAVASLPAATRAWLDPAQGGIPFTPWPGDEVVRHGALAQIQAAGEGDANANGSVTAVEEQEKVAVEEEEKRRLFEDGKRRSAVAGVKREREREEKKEGGLVGFDLYDPSEE